jgi:ADP-ribose pyrophosphatase
MGDDAREIYRGKVVHLFVHRVPLPHGGETTLEVIHHPGAAAALPFLPEGDVVLVRQYRFAAGGWLLEIPAGKLDPGESPDHCARRETEEEVGLRAGRLVSLGSILTTPGFTDEVIHLYEAHDLEPAEARLEADEVLAPVRMPFAEAVRLVVTGEIRDAKTVAAILLAARRRPQRAG